MKTTKFLAVISVLLSLLLHLLIFRLASNITLSELVEPRSEKEDTYSLRITDVPPEELDALEKNPREPEENLNPEVPKAELKTQENDLESEAPELPDTAMQAVEELLRDAELFDAPVDDIRIAGVEGAAEKFELQEDAYRPVTAPRPEIVAIDAKNLSPERLELAGRLEVPKLERTAVPSEIMLPSLAREGALMDEYRPGQVRDLHLKAGRPSFGLPDLQGSLLSGGTTSLNGTDSGLVDIKAGEGLGGSGEVKSFDDFVEVKVTVTRDKTGLGGYCRVDILPNRSSDSMPDIPKDVLFIIDRSSSISLPKFQQFKTSVQESLAMLSPQDRFNVVAFNADAKAIYEGFTPASRINLHNASAAVGKFSHGGKTDVFGGLAPFVRKSNGNPKRPLNIFLLTDGRSTVNIHEPNIFLRQIIDMNPGNVSIFPCSAGDKANRQLLDFLGYLNRGEKCHVQELEALRPEMVKFISRHSSLIVMDLKCDVISGILRQDAYPQSLPHLYRGKPLVIYGRFTDINDQLVLRFTGLDAKGRKRDLIFRRRLADCETGTPQLAKNWAGQKILHLLAMRNSTDNPNTIRMLNNQIAQLSRQFSIYTSY